MAPRPYDEKGVKKFFTPQARPALEQICRCLAGLGELTEAAVNQCFHQVQQESGLKMKDLAQAVRLALTGRTASPGLFEIIEILGVDEVCCRLRAAQERCGS